MLQREYFKMADEDVEDGVLDYSGYGLKRLEVPTGLNPHGLLLDNNSISKIENLQQCQDLQQLSLASNSLVRMIGVSQFVHLTVLRLSNNSIQCIEGLNELVELTWLDLSGNNVKAMENLKSNIHLRHLDLCDNSISSFGDVSTLVKLKTLLLHGNMINTLKPVPSFLPECLRVLSLESNDLCDLNELCYLSSLPDLDQLSLANNPCVLMTALTQGFDYRPYVLNWCPALRLLDGFVITEKEKLQGEWLYCQGKGRHFRLGEQLQLVQYLASVCPLTASEKLKTEEDAKLSRILSKQRYHQTQLQTQPGPVRSETSSPRSALSADTSGSTAQSARSPRDLESQSGSKSLSPNHSQASAHRSPVAAWAGSHDDSGLNRTASSRSPQNGEALVVQDVTADDFDTRSSVILLDSESVYLPVDVPGSPSRRPMTAPTATTPSTTAFISALTTNHVRPSTGMALETRETKYESLERRVIKPFNQSLVKGNARPKFDFSPPQSSGTGPSQRVRRPTPPTAESQDYDTSIDAGNLSDQDSMEKVPTQELSLIKDKIGARKARKNSPPTIEERKARLFDKREKGDKNDLNRSNIPVLSTGSQRASSVTKPGDTKSVKGKLNQEKLEESGRHKSLSNTASSVHDSGFLSRPCSDAVLGDTVSEDHKAATVIQAWWRGYRVREHDAKATSVRREIRARRAEDHIVLLKAELERYKQQSSEEKKLRALQMEAIKTLWQEVQSLQTWKSEVLASQSLMSSQDSNHKHFLSVSASQRSSSSNERSDTLERFSDSTARSAFSPMEVERQKDLEKTCVSLQSQVSQLKQALDTISSAVFHSNSINLAHTQLGTSCSLRVTGNFEQELESLQSLSSGRWGSVPHSLSPYPSEEEETYFHQVPQSGVPTPPRGLRLEHKGDDSIMLQWQKSILRDESDRNIDHSILGYRVYVNDKCLALVSNSRPMGLVVGLDPTTTYKFYVKALSGLGESYESNIIMAKLAKESDKCPKSESSDSDVPEDSDKDHDSTETHEKRRHRKRETRKTRKVKSPRSEKSRQYADRATEHQASDRLASPSLMDRPESSPKQRPDAVAAILTTPRRHVHKKNRSGEYAQLHDRNADSSQSSKQESEGNPQSSPSDVPRVSSSSSPSSVTSSPTKSCPPRASLMPDDAGKPSQSAVTDSTGVGMSGTFTVDRANSYLQSITASVVLETIASSKAKLKEAAEKDDSSVKTHRRKRSSDFKMSELDVKEDGKSDRQSVGSADGDSVSELDGDSVSHRQREAEKRLSDGTSDDSQRDSKVKGHRRKRSKDLQNQLSDLSKKDEDFVKKLEPVDKQQSKSDVTIKPIIDGRKRHSSGSRPSSPMLSEPAEKDLQEKKRIPVAETLEQRLLNMSKSSSLGSLSGKPESGARPRQLPDPSVVLEESEMRKRTSSIGSEGDLSQSAKSEQKSIASKLLHKLQSFSKSQEKIREKSRRKNSMESRDSKPPSEDEGQTTRIRRVSDSDHEGSADSSLASKKGWENVSGSQSDDSRSTRPKRTHRRTPSDGKLMPPLPGRDSEGDRPTHSPIIMEGATVKKGSTNVRRHASFHGLLPSKKDKHGTPSNEDGDSGRSDHGSSGIALPTELISKVRRKLRSRSPSPSQRQPVLSAQKQNKS